MEKIEIHIHKHTSAEITSRATHDGLEIEIGRAVERSIREGGSVARQLREIFGGRRKTFDR